MKSAIFFYFFAILHVLLHFSKEQTHFAAFFPVFLLNFLACFLLQYYLENMMSIHSKEEFIYGINDR